MCIVSCQEIGCNIWVCVLCEEYFDLDESAGIFLHPVISPGRWFSAINYMVHAIMYSYYTIRASGNRTPKFIPICITTCQILQMVAGTYLNRCTPQFCFRIFPNSPGSYIFKVVYLIISQVTNESCMQMYTVLISFLRVDPIRRYFCQRIRPEDGVPRRKLLCWYNEHLPLARHVLQLLRSLLQLLHQHLSQKTERQDQGTVTVNNMGNGKWLKQFGEVGGWFYKTE